jgi:hypothetical protein
MGPIREQNLELERGVKIIVLKEEIKFIIKKDIILENQENHILENQESKRTNSYSYKIIVFIKYMNINNKRQTIFTIEWFIEIFVYFIIVIKILFLITSISYLLLSHITNPSNKIKSLNVFFLGWKSKIELVFTILMSCLIIFIFTPWRDNTVFLTTEIKFLFYLFGFILIFGANWELIIPDVTIFSITQSTID